MRPVYANDGRIAARGLHCVAAHLVVILLPDPAAGSDVRAGHQLQEVGADISTGRHVCERLDLGPGLVLLPADMGPVIERRVIRQRCKGNVGHSLAIPFEDHMARLGYRADHGKVEFPFAEDGLGKVFPTRL